MRSTLRFPVALTEPIVAGWSANLTLGPWDYFTFAKNNRSKSVCTLFQRKLLNNQTVWPVIFGNSSFIGKGRVARHAPATPVRRMAKNLDTSEAHLIQAIRPPFSRWDGLAMALNRICAVLKAARRHIADLTRGIRKLRPFQQGLCITNADQSHRIHLAWHPRRAVRIPPGAPLLTNKTRAISIQLEAS
jgi:hypothetical protein